MKTYMNRRKAVSKLANVMGVGDSVCSDIVPGRGNVDAIKSQRHEQEQLEKRIEEEAGQVEKRKCTPIEYLMLFGEVPKLEQVQIMTMDDLAVEDAKRLLDAGCSKRHLLRLYGIRDPGGPYYCQLAELLEEQPAEMVKQKPTAVANYNITWIKMTTARLPSITANKHNVVRINAAGVKLAPKEYHDRCGVRVGIDEAQGVLAIQPVEQNGTLTRKEKSGAIRLASKQVGDHLREAGVSLPAKFDASWDDKLQAWVGQLVRE